MIRQHDIGPRAFLLEDDRGRTSPPLLCAEHIGRFLSLGLHGGGNDGSNDTCCQFDLLRDHFYSFPLNL